MDLSDATVVLTGATTGIGRATAEALAPRVRRLILHGPGASADAPTGANYLRADYGRLAEVIALARDIRSATDRVDLLINNAARPGPPARTISTDGNEVTWQTNYLAPVALTALLSGHVGRIVNVASATHLSASLRLDAYSPAGAYARSKLALVTYTCWLADHLPPTATAAVSAHPGVIATDLLHAMFSIGGDRPEQAAANLLAVATADGDNGTYYDERTPAAPNPIALRRDAQQRLHEETVAALAGVISSPIRGSG
jgi:NAD(P)-dependent dehydrogenase (short-subunit alcohol dehydrogenase family)